MLKHPVLINSIPRAGTNLLQSMTLCIPGAELVASVEGRFRVLKADVSMRPIHL